ncbi:carboxypeptidase regulatory-like domain-containing protein [Sphingobacterium alkalisoli]|uniref:Carboxypeptidase regulatory-like domain-containing protein n=1 Tax=Sphingobacterium alkalisoli TaxID=1874115 RepID=A0A4U0GZ98_9SPHI|nr:carboxypeptidase-like regulatory domain-containing protein [Sphingobacterium alkalisoli]TJY64535.1 carboxypeptidase regulatory-like domain-containing protein [Sphingobacterium alkalisoli]GGH21126.1 hypothetical protein GCM10011418_26810 [Sphingobacterium alkalisoli]
MRIFYLLFWALALGCSKKDTTPEDIGKVSGTVKDQSGIPIQQVQIVVDNSVFFNSNISTKTGSNGTYSLALPKTGAWYAFAIHRIPFNGKTYQCYLHPDDPTGFGSEGAIRNFTWKLTGQKAQPLTGHYGGTITVDHFPGVYLDTEDIQFTLIPEGNLIDGSPGQTLIRYATDGIQVLDVPIGRYKMSARYGEESLKLRRWNSEDVFVKELILDFEPQIDAQCDNCFKLEFNR